jgi:small-conductance mechanosensitive channel
VGDWVVVNDSQGYVKNINVRATEIQTFDRASVFIPNSNLISNPLLNWTHADKTGRVIVPVGVAYGTEPRQVEAILLQIAKAHPAVLEALQPTVLFKGFGDSCLNFELRAFVLDVDKVLTVSSDLCYAIDAAFRQAGIEIPFPQQDVHWRDMERLENLVAKVLAQRI